MFDAFDLAIMSNVKVGLALLARVLIDKCVANSMVTNITNALKHHPSGFVVHISGKHCKQITYCLNLVGCKLTTHCKKHCFENVKIKTSFMFYNKKMASDISKQERQTRKFVTFLEQHQCHFKTRGRKANDWWWLWFWLIWAVLGLTPFVHLRYLYDVHPAAVAALYTTVTMTLVFAMLIITEEFYIYWFKYESYERVYLHEVANLKLSLQEKTQPPNVMQALRVCKHNLLRVIDEDQKNRFVSKFQKWTNKLELAKL